MKQRTQKDLVADHSLRVRVLLIGSYKFYIPQLQAPPRLLTYPPFKMMPQAKKAKFMHANAEGAAAAAERPPEYRG